MTTLIVLFNLKEGVSPSAYESWAKSSDLPIVRGLHSIKSFQIQRSTGQLGSEEPAPFQYVEIVAISDMTHFSMEIESTAMKKVAGAFQQFADNPQFLITHSIDGEY